MKDYTYTGEIVTGSQWPPADDDLTVELTKLTGWGGAGAWTWELLFSRSIYGGTPDLVLVATSAIVWGTLIRLLFTATAVETATLSAGLYNVGLRSTTVAGVVSYYDPAQGTAKVREHVGEP